jgi:hypothetical protein
MVKIPSYCRITVMEGAVDEVQHLIGELVAIQAQFVQHGNTTPSHGLLVDLYVLLYNMQNVSGAVEMALFSIINPERTRDANEHELQFLHLYCTCIKNSLYVFTDRATVKAIVHEIVSYHKQVSVGTSQCVQIYYSPDTPRGNTNSLVNAVKPILNYAPFKGVFQTSNTRREVLNQAFIVLDDAPLQRFNQLFDGNIEPNLRKGLEELFLADQYPSVTNEESRALHARMRSRGFTCHNLSKLYWPVDFFSNRPYGQMPVFIKAFLYSSWIRDNRNKRCTILQDKICTRIWAVLNERLVRNNCFAKRSLMYCRALVYSTLKAPPGIGTGNAQDDTFGVRLERDGGVLGIVSMSFTELVITLGCIDKSMLRTFILHMKNKVYEFGTSDTGNEMTSKLNLFMSKIVDMFIDPSAREAGATGATGATGGVQPKRPKKINGPPVKKKLTNLEIYAGAQAGYNNSTDLVKKTVDSYTLSPTYVTPENLVVEINSIYGAVSVGVMAELLGFLRKGALMLEHIQNDDEKLGYVTYRTRVTAHERALEVIPRKTEELGDAEAELRTWIVSQEEDADDSEVEVGYDTDDTTDDAMYFRYMTKEVEDAKMELNLREYDVKLTLEQI